MSVQTIANLLAAFAAGGSIAKYSGSGAGSLFGNLIKTFQHSNAQQQITHANAAATTIASGGTYVLAAGTSTPGANPVNFTTNTAGRLTSSIAQRVKLEVDATLIAATAGDTVGMQIMKNGTTALATRTGSTTTSDATVDLGINQFDDAVAGDYYELWVTDTTAAHNVTVDSMTFTALGFQNS